MIIDANFKRLFRFIQWVGSRSLTFYVCVLFMSFRLVDAGILESGAKIQLQKYLRPSAYYELLAMREQSELLDRDLSREYIYYYQKVIDYFPQDAAAYGMLGYCSFYAGESSKAIHYYLRAIKLSPEIYYFYSNLANIYYIQKEYKKAVFFIKIALSKNPRFVWELIDRSSIVFSPVLSSKDVTRNKINEQVKENYSQMRQALFVIKGRMDQSLQTDTLSKTITVIELEEKSDQSKKWRHLFLY